MSGWLKIAEMEVDISEVRMRPQAFSSLLAINTKVPAGLNIGQ